MNTIQQIGFMVRPALIAAVLVMTGCASTEGKFSDTTVANMPAFADETLALMGGEDPGLHLNETVLIREYLDGSDPNEKLIDELVGTADRLLVAMTDYSLDLAMVADTVSDPEEQKRRYIENLTKLEQAVTETLQLQDLNLKANIDNAAREEKLLDAMRAGQPIIDALGRHGLLLLGRHDDGVEAVARLVEQGIEEDYAGLYKYGTWLGGHRDSVLLELGELIVQEEQGKNVAREENELIDRLEVIDRLASEIEPHWEIYRSAQRELDHVHISVLDSSNRVRLILLVWVRAHEAMTSGRTKEAEWFTMQDLGAVAYKLGRKLI